MSTLSLRDIRKSFGGNDILKGISLEVQPGEFIALVGPSGCGKSTLLRIVSGLESADTGSISIGERDVTETVAADRNVAMVFQSYALYPHLTASQNIAVPLAMRRLNALQRLPMIGSLIPGQRQICKDIQVQVTEMAKSLKIDHLLDRKPGQMSGGQRQRVALARAMVRRPNLFLMDEPLSNLDANLRVHARGEIVELHKQAGVPTLYVTHDQAEALSMADRVAVMISGNLLQLAPPSVIYDDPAHIEVAKFIGQPRINVIDAFVTQDYCAVLGGVELELGEDAIVGSQVTLAIRPEFVKLSDTVNGALPATVQRIEFLGSELIVYCKLNGRHNVMVAKLAPEDAHWITSGQQVSLEISPRHVMAFAATGERINAKLRTAQRHLEMANG